jgi:hypothetical protein
MRNVSIDRRLTPLGVISFWTNSKDSNNNGIWRRL